MKAHEREVVIVAKSKWPEIQEKLYLVERWCREGLIEKDIAKRLGISVSTLEEYKKQHPEFLEALKKNKELVDYEVEDNLLDQCRGRYVEVEKAFKCKKIYYNKDGKRCEKEEVVVVKVKEFVPPDTMAQLAWLNNRRPDRWRRNANKEILDKEKFNHQKEMDKNKDF